MNSLGDKLDETVIIFLSDNGYMYGEHRIVRKNCHYEECIKMPLVMRYPPIITPGSTNEKFVLGIDIPMTIAQLANAKPDIEVDGVSILPILSDHANPSWRNMFLFEHKTAQGVTFGIRKNELKYIESNLNGEVISEELYDLASDPYELNNRINNPEYREAVDDLKTNLIELKNE
jgi:N-acetylglucosamine-6-sulfatase